MCQCVQSSAGILLQCSTPNDSILSSRLLHLLIQSAERLIIVSLSKFLDNLICRVCCLFKSRVLRMFLRFITIRHFHKYYKQHFPIDRIQMYVVRSILKAAIQWQCKFLYFPNFHRPRSSLRQLRQRTLHRQIFFPTCFCYSFFKDKQSEAFAFRRTVQKKVSTFLQLLPRRMTYWADIPFPSSLFVPSTGVYLLCVKRLFQGLWEVFRGGSVFLVTVT